jgi:hypothetical protein
MSTTTRKFFDQIDAYNARVYQAEQQLRALTAEHEVLRAQAGDFMRLSQFDEEIARVASFKFTFPEGYQGEGAPEPPQDKAAE